MANIIPKLNLNKTPNLVDNNSLVFAKNIRLDVDGTIHRDYGVFPLSYKNTSTRIIDYENILNYIINHIDEKTSPDWLQQIINNLKIINGNSENENITEESYQIVGIISDSNDFYIFIHGIYTESSDKKTVDNIIKYNEKEKSFIPCNCNWSWSGGIINGNVIKNLVGDTILNIGESGTDNPILFKSINLNYSSIYDDESIYTQTPKIPITNLTYGGNFSYVIPNGVYQFFVRYKIRKDIYTDWFPASTELFVGNKNDSLTSFGKLVYTNIHRDSDNSIILNVEHLIEDNKKNYESFQIGFLLSHDDVVYARAWKHFNLTNINSIKFDYKIEDAIEIEPIDLLKVTYGLYNVSNISSFKNKLYISNYTESNFNDVALQKYADEINISLQTQSGNNSYNGYPITTTSVGGEDIISGLKIKTNGTDGTVETDKTFYGESGIFNEIFSNPNNTADGYISDALKEIIANTNHNSPTRDEKYGIRINFTCKTLDKSKKDIESKYRDYENDTRKVEYNFTYTDNEIKRYTINGVNYTENIYNNILTEIRKERYLNNQCNWVDANNNVNNNIKVILYRSVTIKEKITYYKNGGLLPSIPGGGIVDDTTNGTINNPLVNNTTNTTIEKDIFVEYPQIIEFTFVAWRNYLSYNDVAFLTNYTTLIPYQKYKFYIHYIKDSGEISNGFECTNVGEIEAPYQSTCLVIYPKFSNIKIPNGYSACFFSILHTKTNSATIFNIVDNDLYEGSCFDINMMLIPGYKNLHIKQDSGIETYSGNYHHSSDPATPRYFGADGIVTFDKSSFNKDNLAYIINDYSISENNDIQLIKCTPYLYEENLKLEDKDEEKILTYEQFSDMNLLGYICAVSPLNRDRCIDYYSDGSSVYKKTFDENNNQYIKLTELSKYDPTPYDTNDDDAEKINGFGLTTSDTKYIYSNYNLNFVTLSEEPKLNIKTYYNRNPNSSSAATEAELNDSNSIVLKLLSSQLLSDIYTLPNMYKNYTRKTYSIYIKNETIRFDNTIRSSTLYGDENKANRIVFDANDYYNIPTNRGTITNLLAIGDSILVHTKDSMFKFTGSNNLQSSNGEIQPTETQPFNTGVSEVFGSDFGFAGLQYKTDSIVTEQGYIFFDRDSRTIYMYSGNEQVIKINESIEKLFRHRDISNICFANDYYNNRFFISILFYDTYYDDNVLKYTYYPVTLSFNIHQNIRSFVSLHDFYYKRAFNTKNNCYFITNDGKDVCVINKNYKSCYTKLRLKSDKIFPQKTGKLDIPFTTHNGALKPNLITHDSIIDVINNTNFENVKTLNAVNWCSNIIDSEYQNIDNSDVSTLRMAEDINTKYPCKEFRVYTDTCMTELFDFKNISNDYNITNVNSYKLPRYNQGFWTTNYFRNILNANNKTKNYISDENSLIEGKYFVIRFLFDEEFKLETLSLNYNLKL